MAEGGGSGAVVQLVRPPDAGARRATRIGIGLLVSLVVGWPSLSAALAGTDAFEASVVRFLLAVTVSVGAVLGLGSLLDRFTAPRPGTPPGHTDPVPLNEEDQR